MSSKQVIRFADYSYAVIVEGFVEIEPDIHAYLKTIVELWAKGSQFAGQAVDQGFHHILATLAKPYEALTQAYMEKELQPQIATWIQGLLFLNYGKDKGGVEMKWTKTDTLEVPMALSEHMYTELRTYVKDNISELMTFQVMTVDSTSSSKEEEKVVQENKESTEKKDDEAKDKVVVKQDPLEAVDKVAPKEIHEEENREAEAEPAAPPRPNPPPPLAPLKLEPEEQQCTGGCVIGVLILIAAFLARYYDVF